MSVGVTKAYGLQIGAKVTNLERYGMRRREATGEEKRMEMGVGRLGPPDDSPGHTKILVVANGDRGHANVHLEPPR